MPRLAVLIASVLFAAPALPPFPAYFTLPAAISIVPNYTVDENYGEASWTFDELLNHTPPELPPGTALS